MNRDELKDLLHKEANLYGVGTVSAYLKKAIIHDHDYLLYKYIKYLRKTEYYCGQNKILFELYQRRKNKMGARLGITIWHNCAGEGLRIWHYGSVIINGRAKLGKNCQLHGENCIGNKGDFDKAAPTIGDNVDIGIGAKVIGDIYIADDVKIGANAVVTKSCFTKGATLVGIPAREIVK